VFATERSDELREILLREFVAEINVPDSGTRSEILGDMERPDPAFSALGQDGLCAIRARY
jgi:hypothetical protein